MTKDPRVYLAHMLECIYKIERYTRDGQQRFMQDALVQNAVLRNLEVLGEAAKGVPDTFRRHYPQIPWRGITGLRDVLIHNYAEVDCARVWLGVVRELPLLKQTLEAILPSLQELERELGEL